MALYDSATLLSDLKFQLMRPDTDQAYSDAQLYRLLTLAQVDVVNSVAAQFPRALMEAPTLMTSADGGLTYTVDALDADGEAVQPFGHAEVYAKLNGGELYGSTYGAGEQDVVFEGGRIRLPGARARTFSAGPYIRYVKPCPDISASSEPVLQPKDARILIVYRALVLAQSRGGLRDTSWARELYDRAWAGSPATGELGFLGRYATQYAQQYSAATAGPLWWRTWTLGLAEPRQQFSGVF